MTSFRVWKCLLGSR